MDARTIECEGCAGTGWIGHGMGGDTCGECGGKGKVPLLILARSDWSLIVIGLTGRKWSDDELGRANAEQARQIVEKIMTSIP